MRIQSRGLGKTKEPRPLSSVGRLVGGGSIPFRSNEGLELLHQGSDFLDIGFDNFGVQAADFVALETEEPDS